MTFSTNFSGKASVGFLAILLSIWACAPENLPVAHGTSSAENKLRIAVWPFSNQSGSPAPLKDMRRLLLDRLREGGVNIVDEEALQRFIVDHRIRYVGGISRKTGRDLSWELGAEAVLVTTLELYSGVSPPKIGLICRLVSTGNNPTIAWMDGVGLAGDDSIGILELSLIEDPGRLTRKALQTLLASLLEYLSSKGPETAGLKGSIRFWPKTFYRSPIIVPDKKYTVAVIPFFNASERRYGGDIMALHFVSQLRTSKQFSALEPGIVRDLLLQYRIIMDDGISNADAELLFNKLDADLLLSGIVFDYQDYEGPLGIPKVDFSALLIERSSGEVVWACESHNEGDEGVYFFDWGRINTASEMASEMVSSALETIFE